VCIATRLFHHGRGLVAGMNGVLFGPHLFSDLYFADDVTLLAELLELLLPALKMMALEAASLWLEVNWHKTKVQALGSSEDESSKITVLGQELSIVKEFFNLGSLRNQMVPPYACDEFRRTTK